MCVCMCFYLCKCRSFMSMSPTLFHNFPNHCSSKYLGQLLPDIFRGSHAQILHVSAGCASCMSLPGMHLACLCGVCILHVSAGCSYCMSLPGVHLACLCQVPHQCASRKMLPSLLHKTYKCELFQGHVLASTCQLLPNPMWAQARKRWSCALISGQVVKSRVRLCATHGDVPSSVGIL